MVLVEIVMRQKIILVGPFPSQSLAFEWVRGILRSYPKETAVVAVNDDLPENLRVYLGGAQEKLEPVFELLRHAV